MSKESFVFILGLIVFLTPFLGVPRDGKDWILGVSGVVLMLLGYQLRRQLFLFTLTKGEERKSDAFSESVIEPKVDSMSPSKEETRTSEPAV